ncbi:sensor histidine kinase [Compostibacter hankyongensis]|uniref:Signal transduction histidine kinase internal region domain-containing protein n=1 Tax=Compostibacter hankyongensis TaxID=1007089 RepID=A0ABP8FPE4_9BACT
MMIFEACTAACTPLLLRVAPAGGQGWLLPGLLLLFLLALLWTGWKLRSAARRNRQMKEELLHMQSELNNIQLDTIRYKMNPHLFKNTLNAIQSHAYQTYYALDKLAEVLDYILYESDRQYVTLKDELDFALSLIEVNRLKLSPLFELNIKKKINESDPLFLQKLVAPMISIDLIENAFKHADLQSPDAFISIVFELKDNKFALTVSNKISSRPALKKNKSGFGQENFKKRLDILYSGNYKLEQFADKDVYTAHLKIDLLAHKTKMLAAG